MYGTRRNASTFDDKTSEWPKTQVKQTFNCVRCCIVPERRPVYRLVGGHVFAMQHRGIRHHPDRMVQRAEDVAGHSGTQHPCGKCKEICPGGIDIPGLI
jgi:L-lactate utilization protein LutB